MGWFKRDSKRYYYRSVRHGDHVRKVYFGTGPAAEMAAQADQLRQQEKQQDREIWERQKELIKKAMDAFAKLDAGTGVMQDTVLLVAGYHRADRHSWRRWIHGRKALRRTY
jgi:hypothetical protein